MRAQATPHMLQAARAYTQAVGEPEGGHLVGARGGASRRASRHQPHCRSRCQSHGAQWCRPSGWWASCSLGLTRQRRPQVAGCPMYRDLWASTARLGVPSSMHYASSQRALQGGYMRARTPADRSQPEHDPPPGDRMVGSRLVEWRSRRRDADTGEVGSEAQRLVVLAAGSAEERRLVARAPWMLSVSAQANVNPASDTSLACHLAPIKHVCGCCKGCLPHQSRRGR